MLGFEVKGGKKVGRKLMNFIQVGIHYSRLPSFVSVTMVDHFC